MNEVGLVFTGIKFWIYSIFQLCKSRVAFICFDFHHARPNTSKHLPAKTTFEPWKMAQKEDKEVSDLLKHHASISKTEDGKKVSKIYDIKRSQMEVLYCWRKV